MADRTDVIKVAADSRPAVDVIPSHTADRVVASSLVAPALFALLFTSHVLAQRSAEPGQEAASPTTVTASNDAQRREIAVLPADIAKLKATAENLQAQETRKVEAETQKLTAEAAKLTADTSNVPLWIRDQLGVIIGFVGVLATGWVGFQTALKSRIGQFDMGLFQERLKTYGNMLSATKAFAMYFPEQVVDQKICAQTGRLLRAQFFSLTGTLLTASARDRYMSLLDALTRAARADGLNVPRDDADYARWISMTQVDEYRKILDLTEPSTPEKLTPRQAENEIERCARHEFGKHLDPRLRSQITTELKSEGSDAAAAQLFQDYVVLQFAASRLRTELSNDIGSRRPLTDV